MPDEPQNPTPEENSIPPSPQEPIADAPIPATDSTPSEVPLEVPEASGDGFEVKSNDIYHLLILPLQNHKKSQKLKKNKLKMSLFLPPAKAPPR